MNKWFKYKMAINNQGEILQSTFHGGPIEIVGGRFIQIEGVIDEEGDNVGTVLLNFDVVAQMNFKEVSDE